MLFQRDGSPLKTGAGFMSANQPQYPDIFVGAHGDSITAAGLFPSQSYLYQLVENHLVPNGYTPSYTQRGMPGMSWDYSWPGNNVDFPRTVITDAFYAVDPYAEFPSGIPHYLIAFAGTNGFGLGGHSVATELTDFQTYFSARLAAGWAADEIIVPTMLPRDGVSTVTRADYNAGLVTLSGSLGFRLARLDLNATIGDDGDQSNTLYYLDTLHPTIAGHTIIASVIYGAMFP